MNNLWGRQPVMVLAFVQAGLALGMAFGLHFTPAQMGTVMAFVAAGIGLLTSSQVTPMATLPTHIASAVHQASDADVPKITIDKLL